MNGLGLMPLAAAADPLTNQLVLALLPALGVIVMLVVLATRYKRCPANRIMVRFGKTETGDVECFAGGATFVWPLIQDYAFLSTEPFVTPVSLVGALTADGAALDLSASVTAAVSRRPDLMKAAASRLLDVSDDGRRTLVAAGVLACLREHVGGLARDAIAGDRPAFDAAARQAVGQELEKLGVELVNMDINQLAVGSAPRTQA